MRPSAPLFLALAALDVSTCLYLVWRGPFPLLAEFGDPTAYLNLYVHVPASVALYPAATLAFALALWGLLRGGSERSAAWMDRSAYAVAALGWFSFISGTIWAAESWGSPLALDPRQLSVLVLALVFTVYPAIRRGIEDPERSLRTARAFLVAGYSLALLSFAAPYLAPVSLHPTPGVVGESPLRPYIGLRTLLALSAALAYVFLRPPRAAAWLYLAGAAAALALLYPWLQGPQRVVAVEGNTLTLADGRTVTADPASLVTPPVYQGRSTLVGHFVLASGGGVELVRHYSAFVNAALYFATLAALLWRRSG